MPNNTIMYPFTERDSQNAFDEWGANCGPTALAFALQIPLSDVRGKIPHFEERRYTSPSMMKAALANLNRTFEATGPVIQNLFREEPALTRIQWTGPWTEPGANPKWAYRQTHWIVTFKRGDEDWVFDVNGGMMRFKRWREEIVPLLTELYPRADGNWFPTHIWRIINV